MQAMERSHAADVDWITCLGPRGAEDDGSTPPLPSLDFPVPQVWPDPAPALPAQPALPAVAP